MLAVFSTLLLPSFAHAATFNVPSASYPTIQAAVTAAASGDTVLVAAGTYSGGGNRDIDFGGKSLTVMSSVGAAGTIIDCGGSASTDGSGNHRGFYIHSGETAETISGFTIKNGYETYVSTINDSGFGGAIENDNSNGGTLTLTHCILSNNTVIPSSDGSGGDGGAIDNYNGNGSGMIALTGCTLTGNSAQNGGGIENDDDSTGTITLTNCIVSGNTAQYFAGGVDNGGAMTLTGCTLTKNSAPNGGGGIDNNSGTCTLANCIVYGDIGSEITNLSTVNANHCDIQGGYAGTGNINADPLFVNPAAGDFHLKFGSSCIGAGTASGAPATDLDGKPRYAPPSIGAYEGTLPTHVLWDNGNTASIWNYNPADGTFTQNTYGPYAGWSAKAIADGGTDGKTRVLWDKTDNTASIWSLDNTTAAFSQFSFGPYTGWNAKALSVGTDNTTHVLWDNANTASIWNYNTTGGTFSQNTFGPYAGWVAVSVADGTDGKMRVLWDKTDGTMSLWSLDNTAGTFTQHTFGPFSGWTANSVSVGADGTTHVLWNNASGQSSIWNYSPASGAYTYQNYGPFGGYRAAGITDGSDGKLGVLWNTAGGPTSLWSLNNTTGSYSYHNFGPYSGWSTVAISAGN